MDDVTKKRILDLQAQLTAQLNQVQGALTACRLLLTEPEAPETKTETEVKS